MKTSQVLRIVFPSIVFGCAGTTFSQSLTGSISGTVTDQNNAVVQGASVSAKNIATGFVRSEETNSSGVKPKGVGLQISITSPYPHLRQYLFSNGMTESPDGGATCLRDAVAMVKELKREVGNDIWHPQKIFSAERSPSSSRYKR